MTNPIDIPALVFYLRSHHGSLSAEWQASDALEQLQAEKRLSLEEQSQLKHYPELLQQYVVERDLARKAEAERDALRAKCERYEKALKNIYDHGESYEQSQLAREALREPEHEVSERVAEDK